MAIAYYDLVALVIILVFLVLRFRFNFASRFIVVVALFFLAGAAISSGLGTPTLANELVIIAFYLLAAGIVLLTFDHVYAARGPVKEGGTLHRSYIRMKGFFDRLRS
jgi:hypothetical protein